MVVGCRCQGLLVPPRCSWLQSEAQILSARSLLGPYARLVSTSECTALASRVCMPAAAEAAWLPVPCLCLQHTWVMIQVAPHYQPVPATHLEPNPSCPALPPVAVCHNGTVLRAGTTAEKRLRASAMLALTKLMIVRPAVHAGLHAVCLL